MAHWLPDQSALKEHLEIGAGVVVDVIVEVSFSVAPSSVGTGGTFSVRPESPRRRAEVSGDDDNGCDDGNWSHMHSVELISSSRLFSPLRFFQMWVSFLLGYSCHNGSARIFTGNKAL